MASIMGCMVEVPTAPSKHRTTIELALDIEAWFSNKSTMKVAGRRYNRRQGKQFKSLHMHSQYMATMQASNQPTTNIAATETAMLMRGLIVHPNIRIPARNKGV